MQYILLIVGVLTTATGVYLVKSRADNSIPGLALALIGLTACATSRMEPTSTVFEGFGAKVSFQQSLESLGKSDIGPMRLDIQAIHGDLQKQQAFNEDLMKKLAILSAKSGISNNNIRVPDVEFLPSTATKTIPSVIIFYRDTRYSEASSIRRALTSANYNASMINSSLDEATVRPNTPGTTMVVSTESGQGRVAQVVDIVKRAVGGQQKTVLTQGPFALQRGDLQIYLF